MKRQRRTFSTEFKHEAACLVLDQGYSIPEGSRSLDVGETALRHWVQQLKLELSRIGRVINPPESGSLTSLAKKAGENFQNEIREHGIELKISDNMPNYWGDRLRLLEVFQNLIENAVKFMGEQPSPCIEINAATNREMIVCKVKDNGIGMEPVYHVRIFNLFERLDSKIEGTGIGMALAKRIIEAHGGTITVESNADKQGSCFIFTLP